MEIDRTQEFVEEPAQMEEEARRHGQATLATPEDEDEVDLDKLEIRRSSTSACVGRSPPRRVRSLSLMVPGERYAPLGLYR